jgi:hypothetical protein
MRLVENDDGILALHDSIVENPTPTRMSRSVGIGITPKIAMSKGSTF